MRNAKEEFLQHVGDSKVKCASIQYIDMWNHDIEKKRVLPVGYTEEEYNAFVDSLDFDYDAGYGGQELFGIIWYTDGLWSDRGEYDGSEWWQFHQCPDIPEQLLTKSL